MMAGQSGRLACDAAVPAVKGAELSTSTLNATRTCRLLYYGPADSGKRANLRNVHASIAPDQRLALATDDPERQIAFQVHHGSHGAWQVLVQSVDAGRERPRAAGMNSQPPFDGIVFVVDSGASMLDRSLAAFESLKHYLDSWDLDLMTVPVVLQYNRRDRADTLPVDRLESLLNPWGLLSFPADAARGEGVRETLKAVLGLTVNHLQSRPAAEAAPAPELAPAAPAPPPAARRCRAPRSGPRRGPSATPSSPNCGRPSSCRCASRAACCKARAPCASSSRSRSTTNPRSESGTARSGHDAVDPASRPC